MTATAMLLDRLSAADEAPFVVSWVESILGGRSRLDPTLAVRLLRAYRETGRVDRARDLAATLPLSPTSWTAIDVARLSIERAILAMIDGRTPVREILGSIAVEPSRAMDLLRDLELQRVIAFG